MLNVNAAADRNWIKIHNLCNSAQELLGYYLFNIGFMSYSDISLIEHAKYLYPINRSLTGDGTRQTLQYFEGFFPNFERLKYKSGEEVMDWLFLKSGMSETLMLLRELGGDMQNLKS